jgi:hypothetical protein
MVYCVDIRRTEDGNTIKTILQTRNHDRAYEVAKKWNKRHGVTDSDIEAFYNEDWLMYSDGHIIKYFADVYHDETR